MITPIDEMQIHEHDLGPKGKQKSLKPLDGGQGGSSRVAIQQILNQIHQEFESNQFDKMQVFQTIKRQERFINNINFFLLVGNDPYNFL